MFYTFARYIVNCLFWLFNGRYHVSGRQFLPTKTNYILVGPHRALWDMIYFALAAWPKQFTFMAKKELFKNPILRWILVNANAFSVDRENPGPSAIKTPVHRLKDTDLSLIMFPSGSRHSQEMKGGAIMISKLARVPLVPVVYQGPVTLKDFLNPFKRGQVQIAFGEPIELGKKQRVDHATMDLLDDQLQTAFTQLDQAVNPNWVYIDPHPEKAK